MRFAHDSPMSSVPHAAGAPSLAKIRPPRSEKRPKALLSSRAKMYHITSAATAPIAATTRQSSRFAFWAANHTASFCDTVWTKRMLSSMFSGVSAPLATASQMSLLNMSLSFRCGYGCVFHFPAEERS